MSRIRTLAFICVLAWGCSSPEQTKSDAGPPPGGLTEEQASRVVARVGDETITLGDYATVLDRMDPFDRLRYQTVERRRELLKEMVDVELLAAEARRRGLDKKPEVVEAMRQVLRDALLDELHKQLPTPAEIPVDEVRAYYDAHIADYREPERRRVSAIVVADEAKAKEILTQAGSAPDPATWGKLFKENSTSAASEGNLPLDLAGDLGIVGPPSDAKGKNAKVPDPVREAVFKLAAVNDVYSEPIAYQGSFYIVRLAGRSQAHERSFEEADRQIRVELLKQKMAEQEAKLDDDLRQKFKVTIDEDALAKISTSGLTPAPSASP
ncbi:MAG: peptidyl-prolyl cis-trans isomerase [Polyangiaceae bacterium]